MKKHGKSGTKLYSRWTNMKDRCNNPHNISYPNYGGRGIQVCEEWQHDFQAFFDWAMANGYREDLTLDRINNDGNYEPSNCRWATKLEQGANKRNNIHVTINGEDKIFVQTFNERYKEGAQRRRIRDLEAKRAQRREAGIRPMEEYNQERKRRTESKKEAIRRTLEQSPHLTARQIAEITGISRSMVTRLRKTL